MREYYEAELRLLQESAQEFARAYPEHAGMLNLNEVRDRDPYVERLLEGMAYLSAQIRQHIEDDIPEISETLLNQLWPHFLRPFPSATVINFMPRKGQLQETQTLERGTVVLAKAAGEENVTCRFRTTTPVKLNPMRVDNLELDDPVEGGTLIRVVFKLDSGLSARDLDLSELKIYLDAGPALALWLHTQLTDDLMQCRVLFPDDPTMHPVVLDPRQAVCASHMSAEDVMVSPCGRSFHGFHLLQDFFCFREKYMFFTLHGLENIAWPDRCNGFELEFHVRENAPQDHNLQKENFLLHCAPAVNLYEMSAEPISLTHRRTSYPVVPDVQAREGIQVYSIDEVIGFDSKTGDRHTYHPMCRFESRSKNARYYTISRRDTGTGRVETYLSVGGGNSYGLESLSCTITATNGAYPRRYLREGSLCQSGPGFPSYVKFKNLTRPTRALEPPRREQFQWELISHLSLNYGSLMSLGVLKRVLSMYDWTDEVQNARRIDGIRSVECSPIEKVRHGALVRGMEIRITLHEENYSSLSDIRLFGRVLQRFFTMYTVINCFIQLKIYCHPSNREFIWKPIFGENSPV